MVRPISANLTPAPFQERGCVEDQPQERDIISQFRKIGAVRVANTLRLVPSRPHTAALRRPCATATATAQKALPQETEHEQFALIRP